MIHYYGVFLEKQCFHQSQALEVKLLNLEDVSEEREMRGSIVLDRQSAKPGETLRHLAGVRFRFSNRETLCLTGKRIKININLEEV